MKFKIGDRIRYCNEDSKNNGRIGLVIRTLGENNRFQYFVFLEATDTQPYEAILAYEDVLRLAPEDFRCSFCKTIWNPKSGELKTIKPDTQVFVAPCRIGSKVYQYGKRYTPCSEYDYAPRYEDDPECEGCESVKCDSKCVDCLYTGTVLEIHFGDGWTKIVADWDKKTDFSRYVIGKSVFLTKEEADNGRHGTRNGG